MSKGSLREQFEAWIESTAIQDTKGLFAGSRRDSERYANPMLQSEWQAYQAGHAVNAELLEALVFIGEVELPDERILSQLELSKSFVELKVSLEYIAMVKSLIAKAMGESDHP